MNGYAKDQFSNAAEDPDDWSTGNETMTGAQASRHIDQLQQKIGRGKTH